MIVDITTSNSSVFAKVFSLKSIPYNSWVMRAFIVWVKNLVKEHNFLPNRKFHKYFVDWPFLRNTRELESLA